MSPRNQVSPLGELCADLVITQLIICLSDEDGVHYDAVQQYLAGVTSRVLEDFLQKILNIDSLDAATRFCCLELLLRRDVKRLDTGMFPNFYNEKILQVLLEKGAGLNYLNLKGVWVREQADMLSKLIENLDHLKVLIIPHMANDAVLAAISNCKHLRALDISGECEFTSEAVRKLKSSSVKVLGIGNYGDQAICQGNDNGVEVVASVIENFPNLSVLRNYSYTGRALFELCHKNQTLTTILTNFHDTKTSPEVCRTLVDSCPNLVHLHLDSPEEGVLTRLAALKCLSSLKLCRPNCKELVNLLQLSGHRIQELKLFNGGLDVLDLGLICLLAPNLVILECFKLNITCTQPKSYFMYLQSLELLYCNLNNCIVKYAMSNSPFLKRIVVGDVIRLTDGDVFRLCAECDFSNLEELWFSCARGLTPNTVQLLMGHCPNLRVIGQLSGWDVTPSDMEYLRALILSSNSNLTLLPKGLFP